MDNLTHSLVGWALAETGLKHRTRKGLAACVLATNLPDIDVFFGWAPWPPLAMHRGFTHGLVGGVLLLPPVLAGLLWLLDRWQVARGRIAADAPPLRLGWLLALCWLAALTHPLLDLQNVYAIQLLSPASQRWFHSDGLFIVSPWLLAMLGVGIWRSREAGTGGAAVAALVASVAFIVANVAISAFAWQAAPGRPDRVFASPEPLAFWRREVVWRQDGAIGRGSYDPFMSLRKLTTSTALVPDNMALPLVRQAVGASADAQRFLDWSQMPMARVERSGCTATVTFADARFASTPIKGSFTRSVDLEMCRPPG
ncbi:metal-dependent hydrolase [Novosphingobium olei]|uniref:Metal-dependent hydrolase n=1 Tax=Novosphingobium olei TaxID=2728851 RepID=A0A7Y0BRA6_9SPHN|nr:metal-dependent hydrolase [Novosphingobium olei]NML94855.1 metal-dependent hydrolase [Novosphingobium olei]